LLWFSYPPAGWSWLAWFALVPLILLVRSPGRSWWLYGAAWLGGEVFWLFAISWIRLADPGAWIAWVALATALSFFWPAFLALARLAVFRLRLPLIVAVPIVWVGLEYLREHLFTGFPWYYLAHSQYRMLPLIQVADLGGTLVISLLILLVNCWWVDLLTRPLFRPSPRGARLHPGQVTRATVVVGSLAIVLIYGTYRLKTADFRTGPRVGLLQSDMIQSIKVAGDRGRQRALYGELVNRTLKRGSPRPDLIVWPETSYPLAYVAVERGLDAATLAAQVESVEPGGHVEDWLAMGRNVAADLHALTDEIQVPMLVGISTYQFQRSGLARLNAALLFEPGVESVQSYAKHHLVPFGEYVPMLETFPWVIVLTPYHSKRIPRLNPGPDKAQVLTLGPYRLATAICFEDTVPHLVRRFFSGDAGAIQPDILLNISNDGWFGHSSEHEMHLGISVFRAVENRVPLARSANTGISAIVDGNGRVVAALDTGVEGVLSETVPLDDRISLYSRWGDVLGLTCLAISIGLMPMALVPRRFRRQVA
jgi:apolipoprotein N-acyltransferase